MEIIAGPLRCYSPRLTPRPYTNPLPTSLDLSPGVAYMLPYLHRTTKMFIAKILMQIQPLPRNGKRVHGTLSRTLEEGFHMTSSWRDPKSQYYLIDLCHSVKDDPSDHKMKLSLCFSKILVTTTIFTMILPFRALAETCEPDNSIFNMPLLFTISFVGAIVGGLLARQRKGELKKLNDQLRQINAALRRQAKIESYAPNLSYAPVSRVAESEVIVDPRKEDLINNLRSGKNYLRNQEPQKAFEEFQKAFELAESIQDYVEQKKAARGLGASLQRQGKYQEAIKYHSKVLEIAKRYNEDSGSTEAYGAIADCYTELGDLERAGKFYDKYISRLEKD